MGRSSSTAVYRPISGSTQRIAIGAASTAAATPFSSTTSIVVLDADAPCHISTDGPADVADMHIVAGVPYAIIVSPGQSLNVVQDASAQTGYLYVTEATF